MFQKAEGLISHEEVIRFLSAEISAQWRTSNSDEHANLIGKHDVASDFCGESWPNRTLHLRNHMSMTCDIL